MIEYIVQTLFENTTNVFGTKIQLSNVLTWVFGHHLHRCLPPRKLKRRVGGGWTEMECSRELLNRNEVQSIAKLFLEELILKKRQRRESVQHHYYNMSAQLKRFTEKAPLKKIGLAQIFFENTSLLHRNWVQPRIAQQKWSAEYRKIISWRIDFEKEAT